MTKYIFVTGGVVSGLGKGITAASLGRLLKARGLKVAAQKLDPYINVDPGTMSPYQHGEVYVTEDGAETDLDLGHYERFIDEDVEAYAAVYPNLVKHHSGYPTPEYLKSIIKEGNVWFEGEMEHDTPGSGLIKQVLLDDDPRPGFI